jgi:DNA-binding HxlR family transcriptional regulator
MPARFPRAPRSPKRDQDAVYLATDAIGDAWSWLILREAVFYGVTRFDDFQSRLGIARETLSTRLDHLQTGRLLVREGSGYQLTPTGNAVFGCLVAAMRWGERWCADQGPTDMRLTHRGHAFKPAFCCASCWEPVKARDVSVESMARPSVELIGGHRHRAPDLDLLERQGPCSIARTLHVCGDRWTSLVIRECFMGTRRFDDFSGRLGIAPNILAQRLNRLVDLGMLARRPYQRRPLRHAYHLTERGLDYYWVPLAMLTWARRWLPGGRRGMHLTHRTCGRPLMAVLTCQRCALPVERDDVEVHAPTPINALPGPTVL